MRIGISCAVFKAQRFGVDVVTAGSIDALLSSPSEDTVVLFKPTQSARLSADWPSTALETRTWPAFSRQRHLRVFWEQLALPLEARRMRIDVLHAPSYTAPLLTDIPMVLTVHDVFTATHPEFCRPLNRYHHGLLLARSIRKARRVVTPSAWVRDEITRVFGLSESAIEVVAPGVDPEFRREFSARELEAERERYGLPERFMLWVGNLEPKKNISRLLAAVAVAHDRGIDLPLAMAGGVGWGTPRPASFAGKHVRWLGYVDKTSLAKLYRAATVLVYPSLAEGFGMPVVEAQASGTPVIASAVPAVVEWTPSVARVNPMDVRDMANAIVRVATEPTYRLELSEYGKAAVENLTWGRHAKLLRQIYRLAAD